MGQKKKNTPQGGTYVDQAIHGQVFSNIHTSSSIIWLVVEPTHLKNISQIGFFPK